MAFSITDRTKVDASTMVVSAMIDDGTSLEEAKAYMEAACAAPGSLIDCAEEQMVYRLMNDGTWQEYLDYTPGGGGGDLTIEPLSVTENGTYEAPKGTAYSPVTVDVQSGGGDIDALVDGSITEYSGDVTALRARVFESCKSLKTVTCNSATSVGDYCFNGCSQLTSASLPECAELGAYAFDSTALVNANFPKVESVGNSPFYYCSKLQAIDMPKLNDSTLGFARGATKLESVNLPRASIIGASCFRECEALKNVNIPMATELGNYAFYLCKSLEILDLPNISGSIGTYAFTMCVSLKAIILRNMYQCAYLSTSPVSDPPAISSTTLRIYVPQALLASYQTATNWARLYAANPDIFQPIEGSEYE